MSVIQGKSSIVQRITEQASGKGFLFGRDVRVSNYGEFKNLRYPWIW